MNLALTSLFSTSVSQAIPIQYKLSYLHSVNWEIFRVSKNIFGSFVKLNPKQNSSSSGTRLVVMVTSNTSINWQNPLVSGIVLGIRNWEHFLFFFFLLFPCYKKLLHCKLDCAVILFTVLPIPSYVDLPWLVAQKLHMQSLKKSSLWCHKLKKGLQFLYWAWQS